MSTRIYKVTENVRLVEASSQSQAIRHVVAKRFDAEVASQKDIVAGMKKGIDPETAGVEMADLVSRVEG